MGTETSLLFQFIAFIQALGLKWIAILVAISIPQLVDFMITNFFPNFKEKFHQHFTVKRKIILTIVLFISSFSYANFQVFTDIFLKNEKLVAENRTLIKKHEPTTPTGQQQRISELERELGAANSKIQILEEEQSDREISAEIKKYLIEVLDDYKKEKPEIKIVFAPTEEAYTYAKKWEKIFEEAGWNIEKTEGLTSMSFFQSEGTALIIPNKFDTPDGELIEVAGAPARLHKALICIGIKVKLETNEKQEQNKLELVIGTKSKGEKINIKDDKLCRPEEMKKTI